MPIPVLPQSPKPFSALQRLLTGRTGYPGAGSFYGDPQDPGNTFVDNGEADLSRGSNVLERLPDDLVRQGIRPAAAAKKGEPARGMINEAEKRWPGVKVYLNATGLGSEPKLIRQLAARAERRPGRQ